MNTKDNICLTVNKTTQINQVFKVKIILRIQLQTIAWILINLAAQKQENKALKMNFRDKKI
jgi:hypothetical protein